MDLKMLPTVLWTAGAGAGLAYALTAVRAALRDVRLLRNPPMVPGLTDRPMLLEVARRNVRAESLRSLTLACFFGVGLLVWRSGKRPANRWATSAGLLAGELGVTANSVLDRAHRRRVIRLALEARKEARAP